VAEWKQNTAARKVMNELIYQPEPRKAPLRCLPGGRLFGPSIDHQLTPCQVILSLSTEPVVLLEMKDAKRSFPNEASSGLYGCTGQELQADTPRNVRLISARIG